jgi:hypothetical protein
VDALSLDDALFSEPLFSLGAAGLVVPLFSDSRAFLREAEG